MEAKDYSSRSIIKVRAIAVVASIISGTASSVATSGSCGFAQLISIRKHLVFYGGDCSALVRIYGGSGTAIEDRGWTVIWALVR